MPYTRAWDEASPPGSLPQAAVDTAIQDDKIAVRERLEQVIPAFGDDNVNPKRLIAGSARVLFVDGEALPEEAEFEGQLAVDISTGRFFIGKTDLTWQKGTADVPSFPRAFIIDAGSAEFKPTGNESKAARVKLAIAAAASTEGTTAVVYVPKALWGYVSDADYNATMYNPAILLVREGAVVPCYDPVAYGADVSGSNDSAQAILAAVTAAKAPQAPGTRVVAFTVAGTYRSETNIDQGAGTVALIDFPGVIRTGTGDYIGTWAWVLNGFFEGVEVVVDEAARPATGKEDGHGVLSKAEGKFDIWDGDGWVRINPDEGYNAATNINGTVTEIVITTVRYLRIRGTSNGSGELTITLGVGYPLANLHTLTVTQHERIGVTGGDAGGDGFGVTIDAGAATIKFSSLAASEVHEFDAILTFTAP